MTPTRSLATVTVGIAVSICLALAACSGVQAPTPLTSGLPSGLPSVNIQALCDATTEMDADLTAVAAAASSAADGGDFELQDPEQRVDDLISGLEGLAVSSDLASTRDAAVQALRALKTELPEPGAETSQAVTDALAAFVAARDVICP
jgi:hypothetical protein